MTVTFEQLLSQAKVTLDSKGLYLAKEDRTCEAVGRLLVAVRAMIDSTSQSEVKSEREKTSLAKDISKMAAENAEGQKEIQRLTKTCIGRGLELVPEIPEVTRERLLNVNGG